MEMMMFWRVYIMGGMGRKVKQSASRWEPRQRIIDQTLRRRLGEERRERESMGFIRKAEVKSQVSIILT
jgi:hypothetical protein